MLRQRSSDAFRALLVAAALLLLTAWGNAVAMLVVSVLALLIEWVFFRPRDRNVRAAVLAALIAAAVAVVSVAIARWL